MIGTNANDRAPSTTSRTLTRPDAAIETVTPIRHARSSAPRAIVHAIARRSSRIRVVSEFVSRVRVCAAMLLQFHTTAPFGKGTSLATFFQDRHADPSLANDHA